MFSIWGPTWRLVDGPGAFRIVADGGLSKQADKLPRISLCDWAPFSATEGPAARPANRGLAGTAGRSHTARLTSWHLHFPPVTFFPIFHSRLLLNLFSLGEVSVSTNGFRSTFVATRCFVFLLQSEAVHGLELWMIWTELCRWTYFDWSHLPCPCHWRRMKQLYDKKAKKWPSFNQYLL